MKKEELPDFARKILRHLLRKNGELIYSAHHTLQKGDIYLLGLNPGGAGYIAIEDHIGGMLHRNINSFIDESWTNGQNEWAPGKAPLQQRVKYLLTALGYSTEDVCASNLIFQTTPNADELCFGLAGICWPFHEAVIEIIKPKLLLTFGNSEVSPYSFVKALFGGDELTIGADHGKLLWKGFHTVINGHKLFVAGLPHMSRYDPRGKPQLIEWLKANCGCLGDGAELTDVVLH